MHYRRMVKNGHPGDSSRKRLIRQGACSVEGCERECYGRGYCSMHLDRVTRTGVPGPADKLNMKRSSECSLDGCSGPVASKGMCNKHYRRQLKKGTTEVTWTVRRPRGGECGIEGCRSPVTATGMCGMHYERLRSAGEAGPVGRLRGASLKEAQLADAIGSLVPIERSARGIIPPFELDIWIPELSTGVEFDGKFWHSRPGSMERDARKDAACLSAGIHLVRVAEADWDANKGLAVSEALSRIFSTRPV